MSLIVSASHQIAFKQLDDKGFLGWVERVGDKIQHADMLFYGCENYFSQLLQKKLLSQDSENK